MFSILCIGMSRSVCVCKFVLKVQVAFWINVVKRNNRINALAYYIRSVKRKSFVYDGDL